MNKVKEFLNQSFPYFEKKWLIVFLTTAWIFLIFFVLRPFGIRGLNSENLIIFFFTLSTFFITALIVYISPLLFKKFHDPEKWTLGKFLIFSFSIPTILAVVATFANYYICYIEGIDSQYTFMGGFFVIYLTCLIFGIIPASIMYMLSRRTEMKEITQKIINNEYVEEKSADKHEDFITIIGTRNDEIKLCPQKFLYAEVISNYVSIYCLDGNDVSSQSLRATLSQVSDCLKDYPEIIRCHRAFLVNVSHVEKVSGNSHGYQLTLHSLSSKVPVSKSYTGIVKDILRIE